MKRTLYILLLLCMTLHYMVAQKGVGQWSSYLSYYETKHVAEANNHVYAVANGSLYSYNKEDNSLAYYSRQTGLSDGDINHIAFNPDAGRLLITYTNGNIDLLDENGVYNISHLLDNSAVTNKTINSVCLYNEYAYLATDFGIIALNMDKKEIKDTYKLNEKVYSVCIDGENIYAATSAGLIYAPLGSNLLDYNEWKTYELPSSGFDTGSITGICFFKQSLCMLTSSGIYYKGTDGTVRSLLGNSGLKGMVVDNGKLMTYTSSTLYIYSSITERETVNAGTVNGVSSLKDDGTYWIAAGTNGIKGVQKNNGKYEVILENTNDDTAYPKRNYNYYMTTYNGKLLVIGGGRWTDRWNRPGTFMEYEDNKWFNFDENKINRNSGANETNQFRRFWDYTGVAVDPKDPDRCFISSYGEGIVELKEKEPVQLYNHTNSTLDYIVAGGNPYNYVRVGGVTFDDEGNLWMTNCEVESVLKVLKADGSWKSFSFDGYKNVSMADKITITSNGYKWINSPYGSVRGIFVFDDKGTIDDEGDDEYHFYSMFTDSNGNIDAGGYFCVTEDKEGQVWIGTNRGPIVCTNHKDINNIRCTRIVRTNDDGESYYLLDGEQINSIAVDGGNRKWIATNTSGVFLVSEDGMETIANFTTSNSPLPSNQINSLAINQTTGEVFIGTEKGLVSYMGDATQGSEDYSDVYAYPNPVRPEHGDHVTIAGLMENSNVKITDIRGNIIYQGKSKGGTFTWDCCRKGGGRVATGVYLVLSATPEAKESVVTKIMVVK